jgi:hypothetical protein
MVMIATLGDYETFNRETVPEELREHVLTALQNAEDDIERSVGRIFYHDAPDGIAGRDWRRLAAYRAKEYIATTEAVFKQRAMTPFQSETLGKWSYTLRSPDSDITANPRFAEIIRHYGGMRFVGVSYRSAGPSRSEYE